MKFKFIFSFKRGVTMDNGVNVLQVVVTKRWLGYVNNNIFGYFHFITSHTFLYNSSICHRCGNEIVWRQGKLWMPKNALATKMKQRDVVTISVQVIFIDWWTKVMYQRLWKWLADKLTLTQPEMKYLWGCILH